MPKEIWRDDRVRIITGEYNGEEGIVWDRRPRRGHFAARVKVVLDGHSRRGKYPGIWFKASEVEVIKMSKVHSDKVAYRLSQACQENDDQ